MLFSNQSRTSGTIPVVELFACLVMLLFPQVLFAQSTSAAEVHEKHAQTYLSQKKPKLAIPEFRAVLATEPNNITAQANLGVLLFFQHDYAGAIPYLRQATAQRPDLSKIRSLLGLAELYVGQTKEARVDLESSVPRLAKPAVRIQAGLALIEIDANSRDLDKAASVVGLLRAVAPTDPRVLYAAYQIASEQAAEAMLSLSLVAPDSAQMHEAMALELERALDIHGAIANLRKAVELDPSLPEIHYELAEALHRAESLHDANYEKFRAAAVSQYKLALKQNPRDARSAAALGDLAMDHGDLRAAAIFYRQAFAINPQLPDSAIALAHLDEEKGDYTGAATKLKRVVAADPSNVLAHYRLGIIYHKLGDLSASKHELDAFRHYKHLKEQMRSVYMEMRQHPPGNQEVGK